jgi:hypothetical protein
MQIWRFKKKQFVGKKIFGEKLLPEMKKKSANNKLVFFPDKPL